MGALPCRAVVRDAVAASRIWHLVGTMQVVAESIAGLSFAALAVSLLTGVTPLWSASVAIASTSMGMAILARFLACLRVVRDESLDGSRRFEECLWFLFVPGWRASRYLRGEVVR